MPTLISVLISFVDYLEKILSFCVLIRVILSWFPNARANFFTRTIVDVTQPLFALVYRVFPSMRHGALDFSPIIVFVMLQIVRDLLVHFLISLA